MRVLIMKSIGSIKPKVFWVLATLSLSVLLVSCIPEPPAFTTGIRITAAFRQAGLLGGGSTPVPGVTTSGNMQHILGSPGPGPQTDTSFLGPTNGFGFYDHPAARTNARWTVAANFAPVLPQCLPSSNVADVPPDGAKLTVVCVAF